MAVPQKRKESNIFRSFNMFFEANFAIVYSFQNKVSYQDRTFDNSSLDEWVSIEYLENMAGKKGFTLVQIDVCTRIRGQSSDGDRYGLNCQNYSEQVHAALHVDSIPVYDFSVDASNPTLVSGEKIVVKNSVGIFREPESSTKFEPEGGINRIALTYRIELLSDLAQSSSFYD